jgi:hypothetical protein
MNDPQLQKALDAVDALPQATRMLVAEYVLEDADKDCNAEEHEAAWGAEIESRLKDIDDPPKWIDGDEWLNELKRGHRGLPRP